ncbi:DJ-1/PfpI family protein [Candidatus Phytoplasma sacchari]|nr:DJ-1/PfpI family protein [Candidatus Phytoplasma sacchari]KAB8122726.1 DJ-1/PfpI family protein [Candidatus Phytoplasma sacchari]
MKGLIILYNNFEDCEALVTRAVLMKSGINMITATNNSNLEVISSQKLKIKTDINLLNLNLKKDQYDFLILPGGPYVQELFLNEKNSNNNLKILLEIIEYFYNQNKVIGAICAAPALLGKIGLLKTKKFTCYPGYEKYIKEGIYCPSEKAITDENFVTSRSPDTVFEFSKHLLKKLLF